MADGDENEWSDGNGCEMVVYWCVLLFLISQKDELRVGGPDGIDEEKEM